jgi:hypothetical protein
MVPVLLTNKLVSLLLEELVVPLLLLDELLLEGLLVDAPLVEDSVSVVLDENAPEVVFSDVELEKRVAVAEGVGHGVPVVMVLVNVEVT